MKILSHRGYWKTVDEKNSMLAFERSFSLGFGTETDIRDYNGQLVISHDVPTDKQSLIYLSDFFECYKSYNNDLPLALNIKSDGLQALLMTLLSDYNITNYFVFDMSIPDTIGYLNTGFRVFSRQSEYESKAAFYSKISGIWMDEFEKHWINDEHLDYHLNANKIVCVVSPDLHKRSYHAEWESYRRFNQKNNFKDNFWLCTDFPEDAKGYFYEN